MDTVEPGLFHEQMKRGMSAKYLMGIDEGTTGCKACLFDETGQP